MTWLWRGLVNFVFQLAIFLKCVDAPGHMVDGGTKDAEFMAEQTPEVLEDSELLGFNFKGHFGVIWMVGASNNSLAGKMLESPHDLPVPAYINKSSSFSLSLSRLLLNALSLDAA
jgi:hypothetical protein